DIPRNVVQSCTSLELNLAKVCQNLEAGIEEDIIPKLNNIVDKDLTNVIKLKANLKKLILDRDSAKSRHQAALKSSSANGTTKADSIREELEEAETKVEQCRVSDITYRLITYLPQILSDRPLFSFLILYIIFNSRARRVKSLLRVWCLV
ncbi:hypothetical protein WDU94_007127, partial [Cyamophila willieti]